MVEAPTPQAPQPQAQLRAMLHAEGYAHRFYSAALLAGLDDLVTLANAPPAALTQRLAAAGVPMMLRAKIAGLVRQAATSCHDDATVAAQSSSEAEEDAMDTAGPPLVQQAAAACPGDGATGAAPRQALRSKEDAASFAVVHGSEGSSGAPMEDDECSSEEVVPPPKARNLVGVSFGGDAVAPFRERLLGRDGCADLPCLANGALSVRCSNCGSGKGLFAAANFERGALLAVYGGILTTSGESANAGSHTVTLADTGLGLAIDAWAVCAHLVETPDGSHAPAAGHAHLATCGLAAVANHSRTPNARLERTPELASVRRHFAAAQQHDAVLPRVPVLLATRRIARGEEITWSYPREFVRRLRVQGVW